MRMSGAALLVAVVGLGCASMGPNGEAVLRASEGYLQERAMLADMLAEKLEEVVDVLREIKLNQHKFAEAGIDDPDKLAECQYWFDMASEAMEDEGTTLTRADELHDLAAEHAVRVNRRHHSEGMFFDDDDYRPVLDDLRAASDVLRRVPEKLDTLLAEVYQTRGCFASLVLNAGLAWQELPRRLGR